MISLTKKQAREFLLHYHHLTDQTSLSGKEGILSYIKKVGCIQYDPLNVVGQNPSLVLQARSNNFKTDDLNELLYQDRSLIEHWDKQMSIYHKDDFPLLHRLRQAHFERRKIEEPFNEIIHDVKKRIKSEGPLSSLDLKYKEKVDWPWGKTNIGKVVLESLYWKGDLIVHKRMHTRRDYDLTENHITVKKDPHTTHEEYCEWFVLRRVGSCGLASSKSGGNWLGMRNISSADRNKAIKSLLNKGKLEEVQVEGVKHSFLIRTSDVNELKESYEVKKNNKISFLAPLDNLIWNRDVIESLFGFKYRWEVYTPVHKREYGYYVLPVLSGDQFIARVEFEFDKKEKKLSIKNWWWEKDVLKSNNLKKSIEKSLGDFSKYLKADKRDFSLFKI